MLLVRAGALQGGFVAEGGAGCGIGLDVGIYRIHQRVHMRANQAGKFAQGVDAVGIDIEKSRHCSKRSRTLVLSCCSV
jgi:hypothetical protein